MIFPVVGKFIGQFLAPLEIDLGSMLRIQTPQAWSCCQKQAQHYLWPDMPNAFRGLLKSHHVRILPAAFPKPQFRPDRGQMIFPDWENSLGSFLLP